MRGGKRKGAGRPKGSKSKKKLAKEAAIRAAVGKLDGAYDSLDFLQAVYRDEDVDVMVRIGAAKDALPFERVRQSSLKVGGAGGAPIPVIIRRQTDAPGGKRS